MNTQITLKTGYQAVRAQLEGAISRNLAEKEAEWLVRLPDEVSDEIRGKYIKDAASLMSLFTPDYFAECVEGFDGDIADHAFLDFCVAEMNEKIAFLALVAWPLAYDRDEAWSALSFSLGEKWADKVSIKGYELPQGYTYVPAHFSD